MGKGMSKPPEYGAGSMVIIGYAPYALHESVPYS